MATESATVETTSQKQTQDSLKKQPQVSTFSGVPDFPNGGFQMLPVMYPAVFPGCVPLQNQEPMNNGAGIYAVPVLPYMGQVPGMQANTLIPLTYSTPTTRPITNSGTASNEHGQVGQQQQQHQAAPQRQVVVRRLQIAFQLDLLLILKLAAVIFLFNQDGSRQRLVVLVFFASLIYLYQTGALAPLVRWLAQGMQRAAAPPNPPRPAARAENVPGVAGPGNVNAGIAEGLPGAENENRAADDANRAAENENLVEPGPQNVDNRWWGIVKEIQMIVFGFITSLLPGFHNID